MDTRLHPTPRLAYKSFTTVTIRTTYGSRQEAIFPVRVVISGDHRAIRVRERSAYVLAIFLGTLEVIFRSILLATQRI